MTVQERYATDAKFNQLVMEISDILYRADMQVAGMTTDDLRQVADAIDVSKGTQLWIAGEPPRYDDGRTILIKLKESAYFEYYGEPIVVTCYGNKLKTTVDPIRVEYSDVKEWKATEASK